jgi:hypothetical protein
MDQTPKELLQEVVANREVYIVASNLESHDVKPEDFYLTQKRIRPDGWILGTQALIGGWRLV